MHRFHIDMTLTCGTVVQVPERQAWHMLRVLRMRAGAEVIVFDGTGGEYLARLLSVGSGRDPAAEIEILRFDPREPELPFRVVLWQGISSPDKMSWTVEKAVELGVSAIMPIATHRSVAKPGDEDSPNRLDRLRAIAKAACEQSGRTRLAGVMPTHVLAKGFPMTPPFAMKLILSTGAAVAISRIAAPPAPLQEVVLYAGPEGGFTPEEEAEAVTHGFQPVSLGPRILRTETAAAAALAMLAALWGGLG